MMATMRSRRPGSGRPGLPGLARGGAGLARGADLAAAAMLAQTRTVLDGYAAAGGRYREVVIADSGHGPHLDQPEKFLAPWASTWQACGSGGQRSDEAGCASQIVHSGR